MIEVPYGDGTISLSIPADRVRLAEPAADVVPEPPLDAFRRALDAPVESAPLEELAAGRKVVYLLDDATRAAPHKAFIRAILERLSNAASVAAIIATGSHEMDSAGNRRIVDAFNEIAREVGVRADIDIHDCEDADAHLLLGTTTRGTPVMVDRRALAAELLVITSDLKNHYFAGYSNPIKDILPGVSAYATIEHNHSLALEPDSTFGRHPWHPDPARRTNPLAEDMVEGIGMVLSGLQTGPEAGVGTGGDSGLREAMPPTRRGVSPRDVFVLNAVTKAGQAIWAAAGAMMPTTQRAFEVVDRLASVAVEAHRYLIVSPGGDPQDETLYNAQRGLELSHAGVRAGGEVLFVARCAKGVAPTPKARQEFYDRLTAPLDEVIAGLEREYILYSHKAYKFAKYLQEVDKVTMVTDLSAEEVEAAHMQKAVDPQSVVDRWLAESDDPILVSPSANKLALHAGSPVRSV